MLIVIVKPLELNSIHANQVYKHWNMKSMKPSGISSTDNASQMPLEVEWGQHKIANY